MWKYTAFTHSHVYCNNFIQSLHVHLQLHCLCHHQSHFLSHLTQFFRVYHLYFCFRTVSWPTNHTHISNATQSNNSHFQNSVKVCFYLSSGVYLWCSKHNHFNSLVSWKHLFNFHPSLTFGKAEPKKIYWIWVRFLCLSF